MKKICLTATLSALLLFGYGQTVLNEVYTEPGSGKSEFIELYNSGFSTQNIDCFTILTFWESGTDKGWYVIDLPSTTIASKGWYVISAVSPFNVQAQVGVTANNTWNALPASGYLKKYRVTGGSYTEEAPGTVTDLLMDVSPTGSSGHNYFTLLLQNGFLINGFWGGGPTGTLPSGISGMPSLTLTPAGACAGPFTVDFSSMGAVEHVNEAPGSDNGYARTSDGKCGAWNKTAPGVSHTPGVTNGSASGLTGSLTTQPELLKCGVAPNTSRIIFKITGVSGDVTIADDFPIEVQVYTDWDATLTPSAGNGILDQYDTIKGTKSLANINITDSVDFLPQQQPIIIVYKTKRGCFDKVVVLPNPCSPLPVSFTSFTAKRSGLMNVILNWQTAIEINNTGFAIERSSGANDRWEQVGFIASQVPGGNSTSLLNYQFTDVNNSKVITQYRIRQVDLDGKNSYSVTRAVRGFDQAVKTIIYPNPSSDGRVNVIFEEEKGTLDVVLSDMNGRTIRTWKSVSNNIMMDNLNPGFYSLRITVRETGVQSVEKLIVNKR